METASDIVREDLDLLCRTLVEELKRCAGKQVLITGGAGFLGYYLVQTATHFNRSAPSGGRIGVTVFDNFSRGMPAWLVRLRDAADVTVVTHDLRAPLPAPMGEVSYIIHGASIASPTYYRVDPIGTMDGNINGLRNLLDYALVQKVKGRPVEGFLFFSSSEIYGDPDAANIPTSEEYRGYVSCTGPRACYDESKRLGETLATTYHRLYGSPVKMIRPFNVYGPGQRLDDGRIIPDLMSAAFDRRPIVLFSDGRATRSFCYIRD